MGRPKGAQNKATKEARALAEKLKVDPLEILLHIANGNWKKLGYESPKLIKYTADGAYEVDRISLEARCNAASAAVRYIYPTPKAIEFTGEGAPVIKVTVEDYTI